MNPFQEANNLIPKEGSFASAMQGFAEARRNCVLLIGVKMSSMSCEYTFGSFAELNYAYQDQIKNTRVININISGKEDEKNGAIKFLEKAEIEDLRELTISASNVDMLFVDVICARIKSSPNLTKLNLEKLSIEESIRGEAHAKIVEAVLGSKKLKSFVYPAIFEPGNRDKVDAHTQKNSLPDILIPIARMMLEGSKRGMYLCNPRAYGVYDNSGLRIVHPKEERAHQEIAKRLAEAIQNDRESEELTKFVSRMKRKFKQRERFDEKEMLFLTACAAPIENIVFKKIEYPKYSFMGVVQAIWQFIAKQFYTPKKGNDFTKGYVNYNENASLEIAGVDQTKFAEAVERGKKDSGIGKMAKG